jgi:hypothetical protein
MRTGRVRLVLRRIKISNEVKESEFDDESFAVDVVERQSSPRFEQSAYAGLVLHQPALPLWRMSTGFSSYGDGKTLLTPLEEGE